MKKLVVATMIGLSILGLAGCGNNTQTTAQQKVQCQYMKVTQSDMGPHSASFPVIDNGSTFNFSGATFDSKKVEVTDDGKQIAKGLISRKTNICLYEIDVTGKTGWDKLENRNNVYMADEVVREKVLVADLVNEGIYPMEKVNDVNDLYKFANVTIVKGHLVHTHTKECK